MSDAPRIALVGDYDPAIVPHQAIPRALALAGEALRSPIEAVWVHTTELADDVAARLAAFDAIWCVPASPYASMHGALGAIGFARTTGRPFLGTCGGFQHALIEYARDVLGIADADHAESNPDAARPIIGPLACSLVGVTGGIRFAEGSRVREIYGRPDAVEAYHCNYGVNPAYAALFESGPLRVTATDEAGEPRVVELVGHPFFVATLFQPERSALRGERHPLITAFAAAAAAAAAATRRPRRARARP